MSRQSKLCVIPRTTARRHTPPSWASAPQDRTGGWGGARAPRRATRSTMRATSRACTRATPSPGHLSASSRSGQRPSRGPGSTGCPVLACTARVSLAARPPEAPPSPSRRRRAPMRLRRQVERGPRRLSSGGQLPRTAPSRPRRSGTRGQPRPRRQAAWRPRRQIGIGRP